MTHAPIEFTQDELNELYEVASKMAERIEVYKDENKYFRYKEVELENFFSEMSKEHPQFYNSHLFHLKKGVYRMSDGLAVFNCTFMRSHFARFIYFTFMLKLTERKTDGPVSLV